MYVRINPIQRCLMSNKIQPFPPAGTGRATTKFGVPNPWSVPPGSLRDAHLLRTWFEYDSELHEARPRKGINWSVIMGMALVITVSAGFWTGVGLLATRLWK
jgi:hypothetical protein